MLGILAEKQKLCFNFADEQKTDGLITLTNNRCPKTNKELSIGAENCDLRDALLH